MDMLGSESKLFETSYKCHHGRCCVITTRQKGTIKKVLHVSDKCQFMIITEQNIIDY